MAERKIFSLTSATSLFEGEKKRMPKYAICDADGVIDVFAQEADALRNVEEDECVKELVENHWWIDSDYSENGVNYITTERNAEEFAATIARTGLKHEKIAELCGKSKQTICLYATGRRNIPKLVIEKLQELDRMINSSKRTTNRDTDSDSYV